MEGYSVRSGTAQGAEPAACFLVYTYSEVRILEPIRSIPSINTILSNIIIHRQLNIDRSRKE